MVAGLVQCMVIVPADRIKCQQQLHSRPNAYAPEGLVACARRLITTHGVVRGLFTGGTATVLRQTPSAAIYYTSYAAFEDSLRCHASRDVSALLAGGLAGVASCALTHPIDVVKSVMQGSSGVKGGCSISETVMHLNRVHGGKWFVRGIAPTLLRAFVVNAVNFALFERARPAFETLLSA
jgi:hypothetical protein